MLHRSGFEQDPPLRTDQKKLKRMQSNRESARRSRMRKQKHLDDLVAEVARLRKENEQMLVRLGIATQLCLNMETQNSVLRTQVMELSSRMESLEEIIDSYHGNACGSSAPEYQIRQVDDGFVKPWNKAWLNQPIVASAEMFHY